MESHILLGFHDVFPEEEMKDYQYYARGLDRDRLIELAAVLVSFSSVESSWHDWDNLILDRWFSDTEVEIKEYIHKKILECNYNLISKFPDHNLKLRLINQLNTLKFLEILYSMDATIKHPLNTNSLNLELFKLLLVCNTKITESVLIKSLDDTSDISTIKEIIESDQELFLKEIKVDSPENIEDQLMKYYIIHGITQYEIMSFDRIKAMFVSSTQIVKALYLNDFMQKDKPELINDLLLRYECSSFQEYMSLFLPVLFSILDSKRTHELSQNPKPIVLKPHELNSKVLKFINMNIINNNISIEDNDFRHLRSSPILKKKNNEYIIISELFYIQKILSLPRFMSQF
ncbi:hypothetical protein [Spirosoma gilvum]